MTYRDVISNLAGRLRRIKVVAVGRRAGGQLGVTEETRVKVVIGHEEGLGVETHQETLPFPVRPNSGVCWEAIMDLQPSICL